LIIEWHGEEYEFHVKELSGKADEWNRNSDADCPIFGADTESVETPQGYEPQCFTLSLGDDHNIYEELEPGCVSLFRFLSKMIVEYSGASLEEAGSVFCYFHNLEYDWLQLVKYDPLLLEMARIGQGPNKDVEVGTVGPYKIIMKKDALFRGSAPHFTLTLERREGRNKRTSFSIKFRDTFSFFPGSLAKASKDLKLPAKKERQADLGQRDYRKETLNADKIDFIDYALIDANNTRLMGEKIRDLHRAANMTKIRPSSPGFAINKLIHGMGPERSIISGVNDQKIMQLIFDCYRGGRTGGIVHGHVENINVYDFHSSYPSSFCSLPSFNANMAYVRVEELDLETVTEILRTTGNAFLRVSGTETDAKYPTLITQHNGKLTPVFGDFENIATTGYELYLGLQTSLTNVVVHEMVVLLDMDDHPFLPFKVFAESTYKEKAAATKGTVEYIGAKLGLNAPYGKLIESRQSALTSASDGLLHVYFIEGMEKDFGQYYYGKLIDAYEKGMTLNDDFENLLDEIAANFDEETIAGMKLKPLMDFPLSIRTYGAYAVPAAAALITGISRTRLCAGAKALLAIYWDTDSLFVNVPRGTTDTEINAKLTQTDSWLAGGAKPIRIGDELGDLDCECSNASGVLAGIKRYYLEGVDGEGNPVVKKATHGLPALQQENAKETLFALATGTGSRYVSKPRPMKARESKTPQEIGSFREKEYKPEFHLDERLVWEEVNGRWEGLLKHFERMDEK